MAAYRIMIDEEAEFADGTPYIEAVEYEKTDYPSRAAAWRRIWEQREEPLNVGYHFFVREVDDDEQSEKES